MIVELGKEGNHFVLHLQGGWVSREICTRFEKAMVAECWNVRYIGGRISSLGDLGNEIKMIFNVDGREADCQEFVDYLNLIFRDCMPTGFTTIGVSPYDVPEYNNEGGLTVLREIQKETHCEVDWGEWMKPVTFKPKNNLQYNKVIELLLLFKMSFFNWDYKGGKRDGEDQISQAS